MLLSVACVCSALIAWPLSRDSTADADTDASHRVGLIAQPLRRGSRAGTAATQHNLKQRPILYGHRREGTEGKGSINGKGGGDIILIGVATDAGCGNPTFTHRLAGIFGAANVGTAICLNDYSNTPTENNFNFMYQQLKDLKEGRSIKNSLDMTNDIAPAPIRIVEGLNSFADSRIRNLFDFTFFFDIADEVKQSWNIHSIKSSLSGSQLAKADVVMQVLPSELDPHDRDTVKVKLIQHREKATFDPVALFGKDSTTEWTPCGTKLTCSNPGIKLRYGPARLFGNDVTILEMDGKFDKMQEILAVEEHLCGTATKYCGELTQQMVKMNESPGSHNGAGLFQTLAGFKIRQSIEAKLAAAGLSVAAVFAPIPAYADSVTSGEKVFEANCAACHLGGANYIYDEFSLQKEALDKYLKGGRTETAVITQVTNGRNAMPAFGARLSEEQIKDVASYVIDMANEDKWGNE
jgi:phosphoribulokinase